MKIKLCLIFGIIFVFFIGSAFGQERKPAVAGEFYPANPDVLRKMVEGFLDGGKIDKTGLPTGSLLGLVAPHAGYLYSGGIAGYSFEMLEGKKYDTIIIMGPNHRALGFNGISIYNKGFYQTPLGDVAIDTEFADAITKSGGFTFYPEAHRREHSIEVELPFLQVVLGSFKIVPIVMGDYSTDTCKRLANAILDNAGKRKILIIASSDLSHDRLYDKAVEMDKLGLNYVANLNIDGYIKAESEGKTEMCGYGPVLTLMFIAKSEGRVKGVLLKYANSGDVTGNKYGRIVGYGAIAFFKEKDKIMNKEEINQNAYTANDKKELLQIARNAIKDYLTAGKTEHYPVISQKFNKKRGVFITLHEHKQLRGCIGYIEPVKSLYQAVIDNAVNAAVNDPRFPKVALEELSDIDIEISVLTPPEEISGPDKFIPGKQGIIIKKGFYSAVFLPQVASEEGWDTQQTLRHLCLKAGLDQDEWKKPGMKFFVFTAEVFGENKT